MPLVERVAGELGALVSVDTYKPAVAARGDRRRRARSSTTSAACATPRWPRSAPQTGAALVVMHTRAAPRERLQDPDLYGDVVGEVLAFLRERIALALARGVAPEQLILDPGPRLRQDARPDDRAAARARRACTSSGGRC